MSSQPELLQQSNAMTEEDYLRTEPDSKVRREYIDGQVHAMAGASANHIRITTNFSGEFRSHLKGKPCEVFMTDMKIKVGKDYFYPDVAVVCHHANNQGLTDSPLLVVEVLSQATRKHDLSTKRLRYLNLPSLQEYVLVEQEVVRVTVLRKKNAWKAEEYSFGDTIAFDSIGLTLAIEEVYDRVDNQEMQDYLKNLAQAVSSS